MSWSQTDVNVVINAIGTVESNLNYTAINYNDPITVGVAQWYGVRAAKILAKLGDAYPTEFAGIAEPLKTDLQTRAVSDGFWNYRFITQNEGESLQDLLQAGVDVQNTQFSDDINEYLKTAKNWGFNIIANKKTVQYWCTVYHQSPQSSLDILNTVGVNATLNTFHQATLNHHIVGAYVNRQNTVYEIIKNGDVGDVENEVNVPGNGVGKGNNSIKNISYVGDHLHVKFGHGETLVCYPSTANVWVPQTAVLIGDPVPTEPPNEDEETPGPVQGEWANPLDNQVCTNRYGALSYTSYHSGIDMAPKVVGVPGDPVYAVHGGVVTRVGGHNQVLAYNSGRGVIVDFGDINGDRMAMYAGHLNSVTVSEGDVVAAGDQIGTMGGTGATHSNTDFAVHLHIVILKNANLVTGGVTIAGQSHTVNPETYLKSKGLLQNMNTCPYN